MDKSQPRWSRWLANLPPDGAIRNLIAVSIVALACGALVSTAAVLLQPRYAAQLEAIRQASMANLIESVPSLSSLLISSSADSLATHLVDLDTGCFVSDIDIAAFDARAAENDPAMSRALTADDGDPRTLLKRRSNLEQVHLLYTNDALQMAILPIHGPGYQSTLYAWLVLAGDLNTIIALNVHENAETPGIGTRVEDPAWQQRWTDKQLYDDTGDLAIQVVRNGTDSPYQVDGISGATRTSQGVGNMVRFWTGPLGFGPFLDRLRRGESC